MVRTENWHEGYVLERRGEISVAIVASQSLFVSLSGCPCRSRAAAESKIEAHTSTPHVRASRGVKPDIYPLLQAAVVVSRHGLEHPRDFHKVLPSASLGSNRAWRCTLPTIYFFNPTPL